MTPQMQIVAKTSGDVTAWGALIGWFVGVLPNIATALTVLWFAILIAEKITGKPMNELVKCAYTWIKGLRG